MKSILAAAVLASVVCAAPAAHAKGCIKGAVVGGVAGHMAGHGVLGAAGGCVVGRHYANKNARQQQEQRNSVDQGTPSNNRY